MYTIRERTEAKELRMSGELVKSREEWFSCGATFQGTISQAKSNSYFTVRYCEKIGQPVTDDEMSKANNFAEMSSCYMHHCLERNGVKVRPCIPVFYRKRQMD